MSDENVPVPSAEALLPPGPAAEVVAWVDRITSYLESPGRQDSVWCPQWAQHPEAVWRFAALYEAFVQATVEEDLSSWWVNHFDRHASVLFSPSGIFEACRDGHEPDRTYRFARRA